MRRCKAKKGIVRGAISRLLDHAKVTEEISPIDIQMKCNKKYYGSNYGGWTICPEYLNRNSIIYSFGVGKDISFDLAIIKEFGATVHAFDPTPESIKWVKSHRVPESFILHEYGIADADGQMMFYPPENPDHISHSILERSETACRAVSVEVRKLRTIMRMLGHDEIDLLKMDVEGAEYSVIKNVAANNVKIRQLCVEFHHFFSHIRFEKTVESIDLLNELGYLIYHVSPSGYEISLIKEQ
jgi:FkbM family methyltransferase